MGEKNLGKTSMGIEANIEALLCYAVGWITGLVFFLLEKENKFVRFHAIQSMVVFGFLTVATIIINSLFGFMLPGIAGLASQFLGILTIILWIVSMVKAYQGEYLKLPVASDIAEKHA